AKEEETNAIDVLAFALLCRSRMHAIDLHRALSAITEKLDLTGRDDVDASVRAETLDLIGRLRFQLEVLMQIAVEVTLQEDAELMAAVNDDPNFLQVVYDALYFPSHAWRNEPQNPFSPSEDTLAKFLKQRSRALQARPALP